jgi:DMSO/TMAO reductase YedYZ molybdopterin-dependent catalytic subunit
MSVQHVGENTTAERTITLQQLQLATRNHGMPLEALRYDVTPLGLHYLLTHFDIPAAEPSSWSLTVSGLVDQPLRLDLAALQRRRVVTRRVTMECAGNGRARLTPSVQSQPWIHEAVGTGEWTGTPVAELLDEAGVSGSAIEAVFTGADRGIDGGIDQYYARSVALDELRETGALLVWAMSGVPLLPQHGAPLRLVVPGWYGMTNVKWLTGIELTDTPFEGHQQARAYRMRQRPEEVGEPLNRIAVRSLMIPPGIPDFFTRRRIVDRGVHELRGRAWSGHGGIAAVEVSTDGGRSWHAAELDPAESPAAWTGWRAPWHAGSAGDLELCCRATDTAGNTQPDEPVWNLGGYAVNALHRVPVTVR